MIEVYMYTYGRLREAKCSHCFFIVTLVKKGEGDFKPRDKQISTVKNHSNPGSREAHCI